ncbi:MAG: lipopolysaccharide biosynthesis protein [Pseudomonadota bacterium]
MNTAVEKGMSPADFFAILGRRRWQFLLPALTLFVVAIIVAFLIPASYLSRATILIEQQEIPQDLVRSTVTSYADKRVQTISQRVMTTSNLGQIIRKYDLYVDERDRYALATVVEEMREDIALNMVSADVVDPRSGRPVEATIAFTIAYANRSPLKAQKVANELVSLFLNENVKERRELAKEATSFLTDESDKLEEKIGSLASQIEIFKENYSESLPEMQSLNLQFMQRTEEELRRNQQDLRTLDERIIYLQAELSQLDPYSEIYSQTGERVLSVSDRLKALETRYVSLVARYSADHPDRIAAEMELEALRAQVGTTNNKGDLRRSLIELEAERVSLRERYSDEHPDLVQLDRKITAIEAEIEAQNTAPNSSSTPVKEADNPVYVQLEAQLHAAQVERSSLQASKQKLNDELTRLKQRIVSAPRVEREYRSLLRDYDNASLKFNEIRSKQLEAQLAESLEAKSKSERFVLIEPPLRPEEPDSPNRLLIVILGFILSVAGAGGYVALRESADGSVHGLRELASVAGAMPLCAIAFLETRKDRSRRRWRAVGIASSFLLVLGGSLAALHFVYLPLDILSIKLMRELGI